MFGSSPVNMSFFFNLILFNFVCVVLTQIILIEIVLQFGN
jgi:hypothetical protein